MVTCCMLSQISSAQYVFPSELNHPCTFPTWRLPHSRLFHRPASVASEFSETLNLVNETHLLHVLLYMRHALPSWEYCSYIYITPECPRRQYIVCTMPINTDILKSLSLVYLLYLYAILAACVFTVVILPTMILNRSSVIPELSCLNLLRKLYCFIWKKSEKIW